jgi:hypothetical protein
MRMSSLAAVVVVLGSAATAMAQSGQRYPLVYGPTGHPYGPTQAHYQYQRQYGQPWHGYGGLTAPSNYAGSHVTLSGGYYPGGWGGGYWQPYVPPAAAGLGFYSPGYYGSFGVAYATPPIYLPYANYGVAQFPPMQSWPPIVLPPGWSANGMTDPLAAAMQQNQLQWGEQLPAVKPDPATRPVVPSSPDARLKSLEAQANGDQDLRNQKWLAAYVDYKKAVQLADDRAEAHLRLGLTLIALQHFDTAVTELKRAVTIDPSLPQSGPTLSELFGPGSELARSSIAHKLLDYVNDDIRDPDRLFLMGTLLHFDRDPHAREVLETGMRLNNGGSHFAAFLQPPATNDTYVPRSSTSPPPPTPNPPAAPGLPPAPLPEPTAPASTPTTAPRLVVPSE